MWQTVLQGCCPGLCSCRSSLQDSCCCLQQPTNTAVCGYSAWHAFVTHSCAVRHGGSLVRLKRVLPAFKHWLAKVRIGGSSPLGLQSSNHACSACSAAYACTTVQDACGMVALMQHGGRFRDCADMLYFSSEVVHVSAVQPGAACQEPAGLAR